jgi:hypothetical protein
MNSKQTFEKGGFPVPGFTSKVGDRWLPQLQICDSETQKSGDTFRIAPVQRLFESLQAYDADTNVLQTVFKCTRTRSHRPGPTDLANHLGLMTEEQADLPPPRRGDQSATKDR